MTEKGDQGKKKHIFISHKGYSGSIHLLQIKDMSVITCAKTLVDFFMELEFPKECEIGVEGSNPVLHSDMGSNFISALNRSKLALHGIKEILNLPFSPCSAGSITLSNDHNVTSSSMG